MTHPRKWRKLGKKLRWFEIDELRRDRLPTPNDKIIPSVFLVSLVSSFSLLEYSIFFDALGEIGCSPQESGQRGK